ncbi:Tigger transposable element-derived protein 1 [Trichinella zimbabwensis]|uniref:Tigger transposable element-derived protein 1 n=1 Tax=Trichinella zimbabwensis TaxID=268475 RepID=A0A0V1HMK2_9BILA|nr:Tigger transposable element-derived protein 1 [Trichinella zimbabwensis]
MDPTGTSVSGCGLKRQKIGRMVGINESTGRYVHKNEKAICAAFTACAPLTTKVVSQVREKMSEEAASADLFIASSYPEELKQLIEEKGFCPEQIFNADESAFFWKKMASRTFSAKELHYISEFKASFDDKGPVPGLVPPLFIPGMSIPFPSLFIHLDFIPETKRYLSALGLEFKVLLILNNATDHQENLQFKTHYTRKSMARLVVAKDDDSHLEESVTELKVETVDGGGFKDMQELEAIELIESHISELTNEEPVEMIASIDEEKDADEKGATDETEKLTLEGLAEILIRNFGRQVIKFKRDLEIAAKPYQRILDKMNKRKKQLSITMFFKNNAPDSPSTYGEFACKNTPTIWTVIHSTK